MFQHAFIPKKIEFKPLSIVEKWYNIISKVSYCYEYGIKNFHNYATLDSPPLQLFQYNSDEKFLKLKAHQLKDK